VFYLAHVDKVSSRSELEVFVVQRHVTLASGHDKQCPVILEHPFHFIKYLIVVVIALKRHRVDNSVELIVFERKLVAVSLHELEFRVLRLYPLGKQVLVAALFFDGLEGLFKHPFAPVNSDVAL